MEFLLWNFFFIFFSLFFQKLNDINLLMKASFLIDKKYQILYQYLELEFHLQLMLLLLMNILFFC